MDPFELLGRKVAELEQLNANYDQLLCVLGRVAKGEIPTACVSVDLAARTWRFDMPQEPAPETAVEEPAVQEQA